MDVWIVSRHANRDFKDWELNGVFLTKEAALQICRDDNDLVVRLEMEKDYTNVSEFEIYRRDGTACTQA